MAYLEKKHRDLMDLIQRSQKNEKGWAKVSQLLTPMVEDILTSAPRELVTHKVDQDKILWVKLTCCGEAVVKYS